jgi:Ca-activated chloride channel homolog
MFFKYLIITCFALIFGLSGLQAQSVRSLNNDGVKQYREKKFADAEINFRKGLDKAPDNFTTNFNLGDAYYKQQKYDDALKTYQVALSQAKTKGEKAKVYHNIGNALLKSKQIKESIEAYQNSLKINPNDEDTKYNLSYALNMLKNQKNQQKQNQDKNKQDKNQDKKNNQDQNKKQDQKKKDQQNKQNQQNPDNQKQNQMAKQDATKQNQQQKNKISKKEAERILQALMNNEKDLQKKLRRQKGTPFKTDKDW